MTELHSNSPFFVLFLMPFEDFKSAFCWEREVSVGLQCSFTREAPNTKPGREGGKSHLPQREN